MRSHLKIVAAVMLLAGCSTVPITGRRQLSIVPAGQLLSSSFQGYQQLLSESKLSADAAQTAMLRSVGTKIAASAEQFLRENGMERDIASYKWEFNLIDDNATVNAFCMPGGKVAFYTGIMPVCQGEAGVAVVMGHEVAHAIANHGGERMSQGLLVQLGGLTLDQALKNKPSETRQLWMSAYGMGSSVGVVLPFSRSHESEADHIGLILMARAGYDPAAAVDFWKRMGSLGGSKPPELLSTHPADSRRVADLESGLPEARKYYAR